MAGIKTFDGEILEHMPSKDCAVTPGQAAGEAYDRLATSKFVEHLRAIAASGQVPSGGGAAVISFIESISGTLTGAFYNGTGTNGTLYATRAVIPGAAQSFPDPIQFAGGCYVAFTGTGTMNLFGVS